MALTNDDLQAIGALVGQVLDEKLKPINDRLDNLETKVDNLETKVDNLETKVDNLETKVDNLQTTVESHRDLTLEFYGKQMEHNTQTVDKVDFIDARVDIFARQTVENAVKINKIKRA